MLLLALPAVAAVWPFLSLLKLQSRCQQPTLPALPATPSASPTRRHYSSNSDPPWLEKDYYASTWMKTIIALFSATVLYIFLWMMYIVVMDDGESISITSGYLTFLDTTDTQGGGLLVLFLRPFSVTAAVVMLCVNMDHSGPSKCSRLRKSWLIVTATFFTFATFALAAFFWSELVGLQELSLSGPHELAIIDWSLLFGQPVLAYALVLMIAILRVTKRAYVGWTPIRTQGSPILGENAMFGQNTV